MFDFDPVYVIYVLVGLSMALLVEGLYLLFFNRASYRKNINRRLRMSGDTDQQGVLIQLRRERGLTSGGDYKLPVFSLNRLMLQSGLTLGWSKFGLIALLLAAATFGGMLAFHWPMKQTLAGAAGVCFIGQ